MTHSAVRALHVGDPPLWPGLEVVHHVVDNIEFAVIEAGMASGRSSVVIVGHLPDGKAVAFETSLDQLRVVTRGLSAMAERWGETELP